MAKDREHPLKKIAMLLLWRTQQIAAPMTLLITALNLTLSLSNRIEWRLGSPYVTVMLVFMGLMVAILALGFVWDKKLRMWHEQNVINVERNPFYMHKQTPKEIIAYTTIHAPMMKAVGELTDDEGLIMAAKNWLAWCDDQQAKDPNLRANVKELRERYFKG